MATRQRLRIEHKYRKFFSSLDARFLLVACLTNVMPTCGADSQEVRQHLNLRWGVMPFRLDFEDDPEANVSRTFRCAC